MVRHDAYIFIDPPHTLAGTLTGCVYPPSAVFYLVGNLHQLCRRAPPLGAQPVYGVDRGRRDADPSVAEPTDRPMRAAAKAEDRDFISLFADQAADLARRMPAGELMTALEAESARAIKHGSSLQARPIRRTAPR